MPSEQSEVIKEDDYFRVGDDVIVTQYDVNLMNSETAGWIVGSQGKICVITNNSRNEYIVGFDKERDGLNNRDSHFTLPDKKRRYLYISRKFLSKIEFPRFRSSEREAEYFRNEYLKIRTKSASVVDEMRRKKEQELYELNIKLENCVNIPTKCLDWQRSGFIVTRIGDWNLLTVMQKREIIIDSFVCDKFSVTLPKELVYRGNVYLACNFNGLGVFAGYGVYTPKFKPFVSFHTANDNDGFSRVCIGDLKLMPKLDMGEVKKALDKYQKLLGMVNPYSYLNTSFNQSVAYQKKMKEIMDFIAKYRNDYYAKHEICRSCGKSGGSCECQVCEQCNRDFGDCECYVCSMCDNRVESICDNDLCDDCCSNHHSHCENCGENNESVCIKCGYGLDCGCCHCIG